MNDQLTRHVIVLMGRSYSFLSDEPADEMSDAVGLVASVLHDMTKECKTVDTTHIALLCAIEVAHKTRMQLHSLQQKEVHLVEHIDSQIQSLA